MARALEKQKAKDADRWAASLARDASRDGEFYICVTTTGIFCRPSCPARRPKRENVRFHATCADAEAEGFRACKRCKPNAAGLDERNAAKVAQAARLIETSEAPLSLPELAAAVELSPYHFHRIFKASLGVTPKAYALAHRSNRVRDNLKRSKSVTEAIYDAGFNSSGRFYANAKQSLGMTPSQFRSGGAKEEIRYAIAGCLLGLTLVAATDKGIAAILLSDDRAELERELRQRFPRAVLSAGDKPFAKLIAKVVAYIDAPSVSLELPLDVRGTAFQHRVWAALRDIAPGSTSTYTEVAKRIGRPNAVRAVAAACAANPVAIAIPCHRVIRRDGTLAGYYWGLARKRALLDREAKAKTKKG